jgi:hypothetical protein
MLANVYIYSPDRVFRIGEANLSPTPHLWDRLKAKVEKGIFPDPEEKISIIPPAAERISIPVIIK